MSVIASKEQVDALPDTTKKFMASGWGEPDQNGVRKALPQLSKPGEIDTLGPTICFELQAAANKPSAIAMNFFYTYDPDGPGRFGQFVAWRDPMAQILLNLVEVWNNRDALGTCQHCGNLFVPGRGRTAKFCSPKCRTASHRRIEVPLTAYRIEADGQGGE